VLLSADTALQVAVSPEETTPAKLTALPLDAWRAAAS
jgi:hypothetical protein